MKAPALVILVILVIAAVTITWDIQPTGPVVTIGEIGDFSPGSVSSMEFLVQLETEVPRLSDSARDGEVTVPIFVVRTLEGDFLALYAIDPHLGCRVTAASESDRDQWGVGGTEVAFINPCHGEMYDLHGNYLNGPAPRGLDRFEVSLQGTEVVVNFESLTFGADREIPAPD